MLSGLASFTFVQHLIVPKELTLVTDACLTLVVVMFSNYFFEPVSYELLPFLIQTSHNFVLLDSSRLIKL